MVRIGKLIIGMLLATSVVWAAGIGEELEDLMFVATDWSEIRLSDLQKQSRSGVVVLTFWCTTCSSCRKMEKKLQALCAELEGRATVVALASAPRDRIPAVRRAIQRSGLTFPILIDPRSQAAKSLGVKLTTTTLVLDQERKIRYWGPFTSLKKPLARNAVMALLAGKKPPQSSAPPEG